MPRVAKETEQKTTRAKRVVAEEKAAPKTKAKKVVEPEPVVEKKTRTKKAAEPEPAVEKKTRAKKVVAEASDKEVAFNPIGNIDDIMDAIEKHVGVSEGGLDPSEKRMSTGLLMQDIMLGGGISAGWYTNFGQEQSCKTTGAMTTMASAIKASIPSLSHWDFEGSTQPDYLENICRGQGVMLKADEIFGVRDEKTNAWIKRPIVRYRAESVAEKFFDVLSQLLRVLPDKKKIGDNWYYIYQSKNKEGKLDKGVAKTVGNHYDVAYFKKTGLYRIPAPDGSLQALFLVDSYPAMLPEVQDVDDPNDALAEQARMFSKQLRRVKGRMKGKRVAVIGINILREVPMAMYGPSEKETCGTALKQYSDVRIRHASRALSAVPYLTASMKKNAKGMVMEEPSVEVENGKDHYRFIHTRADKNKLSRPYMEAWLRLWVTDGEKVARGFDPVYDTFCYLMETGQAEGKMDKILLQIKKNEAKKPIDWADFKRLILLGSKETKVIYEHIGMRPIKLRDFCFKQMADGEGLELFNKQFLKAEKKAASDVETVGSDEDDS